MIVQPFGTISFCRHSVVSEDMRRGKEIAQGSHGSLAPITNRLTRTRTGDSRILEDGKKVFVFSGEFTEDEAEWMEGPFTKEFGGVPTNTCLAVGPADADEVDAITGELEFY
jgi:peptidyl-tRNA hydrolase